MSHKISGGCCCGEVTFAVEDHFKHFYFCHCEQCRKMTGSAHASNLFTAPDNIRWLTGESMTQRYDHPHRSLTQVFCKKCGSGLPYVSSNGKFLIVPAGCLNEEPSKSPDARIFCSEQTEWHKAGLEAPRVAKFPEP
ncbi:GFA family protein [Vibrio furnissii]|uniref:GFA family protein n=1 Tax=Vibrio furnissii TaxID=29494 RepID=UPI001EECB9DD|nr:GFA family protein [Vibrio furnissii]MCG6234640.1 GFA family protein [Vibrio furnissii]MCG6257899.1 GFA family protein [Vibrio furnissii]